MSSTTFPCPNPACDYRFDTAQLPPAAMVTCPVCRTRFPYRAGQILGASPGAAAAPVPVPAPAAAPDLASAFAPAALRPAPGAAPPMISSSGGYVRPSQSGGAAKMVLIFIGVLAVLGIGMVTVYTMVNRNPFDATSRGGGAQKDDTYNFSYAPPGPEWVNDADVRARMDINAICLKQAGQDAWVALAARDFKDRNPLEREAEIEMRQRLRKFFRSPEIDEVRDAKKTLGGLPARHFIFNGNANDVNMVGECYLMVNKGIVYVFFAWAKADIAKDMAASFADLRSRFAVMNLRDKWTEKRSNVQTYYLKEGKYAIADDEGVWIARRIDQTDFAGKTRDTFIEDPKTIDEKATMALRARMPISNPKSKGIDFVPKAEALVLELPKGGDALAVAKAHLTDRLAKEDAVSETKTSLDESKQSPSNTELPDNGPKLARYGSRDAKSAGSNRFYIVAALEVDGKTIAVIAECGIKDAPYMEPYMVKLAASLATREP